MSPRYSISHTADGTTVDFSFDFLVYADSIIVTTGNDRQIVTDYTVSGYGDVSGGSIHFTSPPPSGVAINISRRAIPSATNSKVVSSITQTLDAVTAVQQDVALKYDSISQAVASGNATLSAVTDIQQDVSLKYDSITQSLSAVTAAQQDVTLKYDSIQSQMVTIATAELWADANKGVEVIPGSGRYSAKHWASEAQSAALSINSSRQIHWGGTTSGSGNAYVATIQNSPPTTYTAGMVLVTLINTTNTGPATINVNGIGVASVTKSGATALVAGDLPAGMAVTLIYDGSRFQLLSVPATTASSGGWTVASKTTAYSVVAADKNVCLLCSGSWTLSLTAAATLGAGFVFAAKNNGTGVITLDPNGAETINGQATLALGAGDSVMLICDGTGWHMMDSQFGGASPSFVSSTTFTLNGTFTVPAGVYRLRIKCWAGGAGGGGAGANGDHGTNGASGGTSSFGSLCSATGGKYGEGGLYYTRGGYGGAGGGGAGGTIKPGGSGANGNYSGQNATFNPGGGGGAGGPNGSGASATGIVGGSGTGGGTGGTASTALQRLVLLWVRGWRWRWRLRRGCLHCNARSNFHGGCRQWRCWRWRLQKYCCGEWWIWQSYSGVLMMTYYAHITDGVVREVIAVDDITGLYHPDLIWLPCPPECTEGWRLIGGCLVAPDDYRALRVLASDGYAPLSEQLDMQYRDRLDGGTRWMDHIATVKAAYPKTGSP